MGKGAKPTFGFPEFELNPVWLAMRAERKVIYKDRGQAEVSQLARG